MSELEHWRSAARPGESYLAFETEQAVPAANVAALIAALDRDYRSLSGGRVLIVTDLHTGSLFLAFADAVAKWSSLAKDAVEYLKAAEAIAKLVGAIRGAAEQSKRHPAAIRGRRPGFRVVREIVKIAAETGAAVEVNHKLPDGEELSVRLGAQEAREIQAAANEPLPPQAPELQRLTAPDLKKLAAPGLTPADHADAIEAALGPAPAGSEVQRALEAILAVLDRLGLRAIFDDIARELVARGRSDLAQLILQVPPS